MDTATGGVNQPSPMQQQRQHQSQPVVVNISGNKVGLVKEVVSSGGQTILLERRGPVPITVYQASPSSATAPLPATTVHNAASRPFPTTATNIIVVNSRDSAAPTSLATGGSSGGIVLLSKESSTCRPVVANQTRVFSISTTSSNANAASVAPQVTANTAATKPTIIIGGPRAAQFNLTGTRIVSPSTGYLQQQQQQQSPQMLHRLRPPSPLKVLQASSQSTASASIVNRQSKMQPSYLPSALSASIGIVHQQQQPPPPLPLAANEVVIDDDGVAGAAPDAIGGVSLTTAPSPTPSPMQPPPVSSRRKQRLLEGHSATVASGQTAASTLLSNSNSISSTSAGSAISVRCICQYTHDDGNCVQCVACHVWQHVDCMMLRAAESESLLSYQCEQCLPRPVNVSRAMRVQTRILEKMREMRSQTGFASKANPSGVSSTKKSHSGAASAQSAMTTTTSSSMVRQPATAKYREARDCIYTDQFNRRFARLMLTIYGSANANVPLQSQQDIGDANQDPTELLLAQRCRVVPPGRLEATLSLSPGDPVIEYRGRVCLPEELPSSSVGSRFVLYYDGFDANWSDDSSASTVSNLPLVAIDASNLGNDARYVRRSCRPNCSVQHLVLSGRPHLVLVANDRLRPGDELTLPFDFNYQLRLAPVSCACSTAQSCPVRLFFQRLQQQTDHQQQHHQAVEDDVDNESVSSAPSSADTETSSVGGEFDDLIGDIHASASRKRVASGSGSAGFKKPASGLSAAAGGKSQQKANRSISFDTPASTKVHHRQSSHPEKLKSSTKKSPASSPAVKAHSASVDQAGDAATSSSVADTQHASSNLDREERWMQAMLKRIETMEKRQRSAKRQRRSSEQKLSTVSSPSVSVDTEEAREILADDEHAGESNVASSTSKIEPAATVPKESPPPVLKTPTKSSAGRKPKTPGSSGVIKEEITFDKFIDRSPSPTLASQSADFDSMVDACETPSRRPKSVASSSSPVKSPPPPSTQQQQQQQQASTTEPVAAISSTESREDRLMQMYIKRIELMERRAGASSRKRQKSSTGGGGSGVGSGVASASPSPKKPRPDGSSTSTDNSQVQRQRHPDGDDISLSSSDEDSTNCLDDDLIARERRERREARKSPRHRLFHSPPPQQNKSSLSSSLTSPTTGGAAARSPMKPSIRSPAEEALVASFATPIKEPAEPQCDRIIYTDDCIDPFAKHMRRQVSEPVSSAESTAASQPSSSVGATAAATTSAKKRWLSKAIRDYSDESATSSATTDLTGTSPMPPPPPLPPLPCVNPPSTPSSSSTAVSAASGLATLAVTSPEEMPLKKRLRAVHSCEEASTTTAETSRPALFVCSPTATGLIAEQGIGDAAVSTAKICESNETGRSDREAATTEEETHTACLEPTGTAPPPPPPPLPSQPPPLPPLVLPPTLPPPSSLQSPPLPPTPTPPQILPPPPSLKLQPEADDNSVEQHSGGRPQTLCSSPPLDDNDDDENNNNNNDDDDDEDIDPDDKAEPLPHEEYDPDVIDEPDCEEDYTGEAGASWSANRPKTPDTEPPDDEDQSAAAAAAAAQASSAACSASDAQDTVREILKRDQEILDMQELAALERRKTRLMYQLRYVEQRQKKPHHHSGSGGSGGEAASSTSRRVQVVQPLQQQLAKQKQQPSSSCATAAASAASAATASTARSHQPAAAPNLSDLQQMLMNTINKLNEQLHAVVASGSGGASSARPAAPAAQHSHGASASSAPSTSEEKPTGSGSQRSSASAGTSQRKNFGVRGYPSSSGGAGSSSEDKKRPAG